jgi:colanic acid biosynthesis glycosyl transferase WcaI
MKILLVTDSYPPEIRSASHLMLELAQELHLRGHDVTVITTWPEYNLDDASAKVTFNERMDESGICVLRVKTLPHHNVNYLVRGIAQIAMPYQFLLKLRKYKINPDVAIIYSPPLPLALVGSWLRGNGVRTLLNIQDLFPQNAIDLGILKNPLQIALFKAMERYAYKRADIVTVHSSGNRRAVLAQHPEVAPRLHILHNWVDIDHHQEQSTDSLTQGVDFRTKWNIKQKYVAVFAGVMGPSQYLELVLRIASDMVDDTDLLFLLVGDGKEKDKLERIVNEKNLSNVQFRNFVSREEYPDLLRACNIGLVCLSPQNRTPVIPGKILGHMAAGIPVMAFLHSASDGHTLIKDAGCGFSADSADYSTCLQSIKDLMRQSENFRHLGESGRRYATQHFSKEACVSQIELLLGQVN